MAGRRSTVLCQRPPYISADPSGPSLADLELALQTAGQISAVRRRDLRSAVARVAALLGEDPARLRLDLESVAAQLSAVNPVAAGLSAKRLANIRSDFLAAVRQSGLSCQEDGPQPRAHDARRSAREWVGGLSRCKICSVLPLSRPLSPHSKRSN